MIDRNSAFHHSINREMEGVVSPDRNREDQEEAVLQEAVLPHRSAKSHLFSHSWCKTFHEQPLKNGSHSPT